MKYNKKIQIMMRQVKTRCDPHCKNCGIEIKLYMEYVKTATRIRYYGKIYCIKCAKELYII